MNLNISPNPLHCINAPGGVNSVVSDHVIGFLAAGYEINKGEGLNIIHALEQHKDPDVYHCHGLYPIGEGYFDKAFSRANGIVLQNALKAKVTVCISEFSANILRHKLHIDPIVTRNGIWINDYERGGAHNGPILFPKAALDANAKPDDILWLKKNTGLNLMSIANIQGVKSTGKLSRQDFITTLWSCSIYLGTTKENSSMATMEAMVMGIPVVGYDIGFNSEWLISGTGCELVPFGDRLALHEAIVKIQKDWHRYSNAARDYAQIFDWQPVIDELLGIYERVARTPESKSVSIIIPCYNLAAFVSEAIQSALAQTLPCEVIVIDDASTDESLRLIKQHKGITVIENKINLGVAETRNKAIRSAKGEYIICLDADDKLYPDFAEKHLAAFRSRADAIAYARINLIDTDGRPRKQVMFSDEARPVLQATGRNQIPSCCMFRKSFWMRAGGYESRFTPAEDANLWLKIFQLGGLAHKASNKPLMDYRIHENQISKAGFPDWWTESQIDTTITERDPEITIILNKHDEKAKETLWSLENQTYKKWSCLLQSPNSLAESFPWLNRMTHRRGSVLYLEAGTRLHPNFLVEYVQRIPPWIQG